MYPLREFTRGSLEVTLPRTATSAKGAAKATAARRATIRMEARIAGVVGTKTPRRFSRLRASRRRAG